MGEIALRRFFLAVFCALALSLSALAADAALPSLEAAVNVREDGVCEVTMTAEVDFSAAQDSLLIPLGTDARDITLAGWSYETVLQDGVTCLKLSNPAGFSGKQQFTCSYTLPCRAAEAADGQQFRLSLPETGWDYAIDSYTLTMTFPAEVTNAPEWTSGYYGDVVDNYLDIRTQENTVTAKSTAAMRDHETLTVAVQFPADTFNLRDQPGKTAGFDRIAFLVLLAAAVVFLVFYGLAQQTPSVPMSTVQQATHYVRGRVVEVTDNAWQGQQDYEDIPVGKQTVRVELRSGKYRGQVYELPNQLSYLYGTILKAGDAVTVAVTEEDGEISSMTLQDYDRTVPLALVVLAFLVVTVLVGRRVGAKSLLGLGLTVVCIFSILIPLLLGGWPTLPTILGMCAYVTVVEFVILGGVNRKTLCAILGTISGVAFAALFGELACALLRVNGYKMYSAEPTIEALLQIKQGQDPMHSLQLGDLLVGGIVIAALGAVNDVAMSISSAMNELVAVNPALTRRQLLRSGMNIGRDMVGTMTNTLILALVGSSLVLMIYLSSLEPSFSQLMSGTFFSVEMVQAIASSIGVILAVPLSALIGAFLFAKHKK